MPRPQLIFFVPLYLDVTQAHSSFHGGNSSSEIPHTTFPFPHSQKMFEGDPAHYSGGLLGLIILILDLIAIFEVLNSSRSVTGKLLWSLMIFIFPILGLILYFLFGNRDQYNTQYEQLR